MSTDTVHEPTTTRRSGPAVVMAIALVGALVLLAIAPFQLVAQADAAAQAQRISDADWDRIRDTIADYDGPVEQRLGEGPSAIMADADGKVFAFSGRSAAGSLVLGVARLDGESARTSTSAGQQSASAIFQLPGDDRYILVWGAAPDETSVAITMNFFTDKGAAEQALASGSTEIPAP